MALPATWILIAIQRWGLVSQYAIPKPIEIDTILVSTESPSNDGTHILHVFEPTTQLWTFGHLLHALGSHGADRVKNIRSNKNIFRNARFVCSKTKRTLEAAEHG